MKKTFQIFLWDFSGKRMELKIRIKVRTLGRAKKNLRRPSQFIRSIQWSSEPAGDAYPRARTMRGLWAASWRSLGRKTLHSSTSSSSPSSSSLSSNLKLLGPNLPDVWMVPGPSSSAFRSQSSGIVLPATGPPPFLPPVAMSLDLLSGVWNACYSSLLGSLRGLTWVSSARSICFSVVGDLFSMFRSAACWLPWSGFWVRVFWLSTS